MLRFLHWNPTIAQGRVKKIRAIQTVIKKTLFTSKKICVSLLGALFTVGYPFHMLRYSL